MLDIYDINYEFCNEKLNNLSNTSDTLPRKGIAIRIISLFKNAFFYLRKKKENIYLPSNSILFFSLGVNDYNSAKSLQKEIPNSFFYGNDSYQNGFPLSKIYLFSIFFIPIVFIRYLMCSTKYHKKSYSYIFDSFCITYSANFLLMNHLIKINPKKIIILNQLGSFHRLLAQIATKSNIETVYMQHASLTENFSNLNIFNSFVLLEGRDSLIKMQKSGTVNKKIFLIGMPKFDFHFSKIKKADKISNIGLCSNGLDDFDSYNELIKNIKVNFDYLTITLRPHPSDRRNLNWSIIAKKNNINYSDSTKVDSFSFFNEIDLLIAGDSSIHLEAALLNIPSIYFDTYKKNIDWYGFRKNNLIHYADNISEIIRLIDQFKTNMPKTREKTKFYCDSVNTKFDGNSTLLAKNLISDLNFEIYFSKEFDEYSNIIYSIK